MSTIRVLHVEDDPSFADLTADMLGRMDDRFVVETAHEASDGLARLRETDVDCIVSDYEMPGRDGIEFLEAVRDEFADLPFILFTGKGSESVASEAISAGVTDYLQKGSGTERYELLANRIETAVSQYRTERELERQNDLFAKAQDIADVGAWEYNVVADRSYVSERINRIHGLDPDAALPPERSLSYYHPEDRPRILSAFEAAVEEGRSYDLEARLVPEDGDRCWVRTRGEAQFEDGEIVRVRGTLQDITERKRRENELERQNERLEEFAHIVSHDIQSPLGVASAQLDLAERTGDEEAFRRVRAAHDRIEAIVDDVLTLAKQGQQIGDRVSVDIDSLAQEAWRNVDTSNVTLTTVGEYQVDADPERLRQLFGNLFRNAAEHAGTDVTVSVGPIEPFPTTTRGTGDQPRGFYVADDGAGIPEEKRDDVFEAGYSTAESGTGFGLPIVEQVAQAHGWEVRVIESTDGGARFEITGVDSLSASGSPSGRA